ncbi:tetratricopeptide repeat protein, partial [Candidatus Sumerlaeota bacterium]|nr:tetratricopeptide repeat protein [Candidatus Sumerlaeota bacterium]
MPSIPSRVPAQVSSMCHRRRVDALVAKRTALQACALLLMLLAACSNKSAEQRLGEARTLLEEGNVLGAIIAYEDLVKKFPDSPMINEARIGLAQAYFSDSDYASSRELLDEVIVATGGRGTGMGHAAAMLKLDTYMAEEKFSAALDDARVTSASLSMLDPNLRGEFLLSLGQILAVNDFADEAMKVFSEALRDDPVGPEQQMSHMDTLSSAFNILMRGSNVDATMALYDEYFILHPDSELRGEISRDLGFIFRYVEMRDIATNLFLIAETIFRGRMEGPIDADERSYLVFVLAQVLLLQDKVDDAQEM